MKWNELFEAHVQSTDTILEESKEVKDDDSEEVVDEVKHQLATQVSESYGRAFLANDTEAGLEFLVFLVMLHEREWGGALEMEPYSLGRFYLTCKMQLDEEPDGDLTIRFNELYEAALSARDSENKEQA